MTRQTILTLSPRPRGFHLVTDEVEAALSELELPPAGVLHVFVQHTSASLTLNENADPDVRGDFDRHLRVMVPEGAPHFRHTCEGPDDMPAHLTSSLMGSSVTVPFARGRLLLGTWQGVYLGEHRDHGGARRLVLTVLG